MLHGVTAYAFMLPVSAAVATACQLAGIGGAALFSPIFLLGFPLLGDDYPLDSAAAAIATALLTEVFGFASGLIGYSRRGLVCWPVVLHFARISVPAAFAGAVCAGTVAHQPTLLRSVYSALMLSLSAMLLLSSHDNGNLEDGGAVELERLAAAITSEEATDASASSSTALQGAEPRHGPRSSSEACGGISGYAARAPRRRTREQMVSFTSETDGSRYDGVHKAEGLCSRMDLETRDLSQHTDAAGRAHSYYQPPNSSASCLIATAAGGLLTGLLGVGIGEVVLPQLVRICRVPLPLAAGTSVACVVLTAAAAALVQLVALVASANGEVLHTIPWRLVCWTIPGVIIGGQIAPCIAGRRLLSDTTIERLAAVLFLIVGVAFAAKAISALPSSGPVIEGLVIAAALLLFLVAVWLGPAPSRSPSRS